MEGEDTLILVEGSDDALARLKDILGDEGIMLGPEEKHDVYRRIKEDEDSVAEGLGLMFG